MPAMPLVLLIPLLVALSPPLPSTDSVAFRGREHLITVKLETELGMPIENATIYFYHEEQNIFLGASLTNQTGHAAFAWQVPLTHRLGAASLNATFPGDDEKHLLPCYLPILLTIVSQTGLSVEASDEKGTPIKGIVYPDQALVFAASVQDDQGQPLEGILVRILGTENQTVAAGSTAENGIVVLRHRLGSMLAASVFFRVQSSSVGYFVGSQLELQFSAEKSPSMFVGLPSFLKAADPCVIAGRLRHEYGDSIPMARIRVLLDGIQQISDALADDQGRFSYNLNGDLHLIATGRFLVISYDGDSSHTPAQTVVGLVLTCTATPFSRVAKVAPSAEGVQLLYWIGLIAAASVGIVSAYSVLRIKRTTNNIVSH